MDQRLLPVEAPVGANGSLYTTQSWARVRLTGAQKAGLIAIAIGLVAGAVVAPRWTITIAIALAMLLYVGHMALRAVLWVVGIGPSEPPVLLRSDDELPIYSIIVAMYDEANIVGGTLQALEALNYPRDRLDVLFAIEAHDRRTAAALAALDLPPWCRVVTVPPGGPLTKPNASNVALALAVGEFVVVFDAEDRPETGQLRQAVAAFDAGGPRVACLQARLAPYNTHANFLTRMFALDFCQWFDAMLTGLQRLGFPIPLGGTSNHFRLAVLEQAGGWDPYNVTEDADLGIRLWRLGWQTRTIAATTWEEAPISLGVWYRQRTRWIRGYMQTFLVHARAPRALGLPSLGFRGWIFLVLFVGASWAFALVNPVFWTLMALNLSGTSELDWAFGPIVAPLALVSTIAGNGLAALISFVAPVRRRWWSLIPWAIATPIYWAMVSAAAYSALIALILHPYRWEKTPHGLVQRKHKP